MQVGIEFKKACGEDSTGAGGAEQWNSTKLLNFSNFVQVISTMKGGQLRIY
jgi:hypothetical protein